MLNSFDDFFLEKLNYLKTIRAKLQNKGLRVGSWCKYAP
jgi:hypothetical protein